MDSILNDTKKLLGIDKDYHAFDTDVLTGINLAFVALHELSVGPDEPFRVITGDEVWTDFSTNPLILNGVMPYVWLKTRLVFDPPTTSFILEAIKQEIQELEFRLNAFSE